MIATIIEIKDHQEGREVRAIIHWRNLPPPNENETDLHYAERVKDIAVDIDGYNNLHIGHAELVQEPGKPMEIPKVEDYGS